MRSHGNGNPEQCAGNLLKLTRGEVPYSRLKGIDAKLIDKPTGTAADEAAADIEWLLRTYEPRTDMEAIDVTALLATEGDYAIDAAITRRKEEAIERP